jgi:multiple sugar transport system permease protein
MRRFHIGLSARILGVLILVGLAIFPIYWMLVTATTKNGDLFAKGLQFWPDVSQLGIFGQSLLSQQLLGASVPVWLLNSAIIALGTAVVAIILGVPLGYALSRFPFRGKVVVALALFLTQMLPEALLVVPLFTIMKNFDLLNSLGGLILVDSAFVMPIVSLIVRGAVDGVPRELDEAARVDGSRPIGVLTRIILPLIGPSIAAAAVIAFFSGWNEYVFAVTFIFDPTKQPASVGLAGFIGELTTPEQTVMAVGLMYTLPAVVFYLFVQRFIVSGLTAGGVKG